MVARALQPADVAIEFCLLSLEFWCAPCSALPADASVDDVVAALLVLNDALDATRMVGLEHFVQAIETLKDEFPGGAPLARCRAAMSAARPLPETR